MNMTREQFERYFRSLQASWGYEGMELTPEEGEQLRRVAMGEIGQDEYDRWLLNRVKIEYAIRQAQASLEIEGQQLQEGAEDLIRRALAGEIDHERFIELALELAQGGKGK